MKRILSAFLAFIIVFSLFTVSTGAVTINGEDYNQTLNGYFLTFGQGTTSNGGSVPDDGGFTSSFVGSKATVATSGTYYNNVLGRLASLEYGISSTTGSTMATYKQRTTVNSAISFYGKFTTPYNFVGISSSQRTTASETGYYSDTWSSSHINFYKWYSLPKNSVSVSVSGLSAADAANTKIYHNSSSVTGSSYSETVANGTHSLSVSIANAANYDLSYSWSWTQGSITYGSSGQTGSGTTSSVSKNLVSGGSLSLSVTATEKASAKNIINVYVVNDSGSDCTLSGYTVKLLTTTATTNTSGRAAFSIATPGTYTVSVTTPPPSGYYFGSTSENVTVTSGDTKSVTFTIYKQETLKTLSVNLSREVGVTESLSKSFSIKLGTTTVGTITTNSSGYGSIDVSAVGTYTVTPVSALSSGLYYSPTSASVYVSSSGSASFVIRKTAQTSVGAITVNLSRESGVTESIGGRSFSLYNSSGTPLSSATTDSGGYAYFTGISAGTYTVKSGTAPAGHSYSPTNRNVTVTAGETATAAFTLCKSTEPTVFGYVYAYIYRGSGVFETITGHTVYLCDSSGKVLSSSSTDTSGYAYFYGLPYGSYVLKTGTAPTGYYFTPTSSSVELSSYSAGASFCLNDDSALTNGSITVDLRRNSDVTESLFGKTFSLYNASGTKLSSATTNSSGYAYFTDLSAGNYTVKSGTAPSGLYYSPTEKAVEVTAGNASTATFTLCNTSTQKGSITVDLYRDMGITEPYSGKTFYLYNSSGTQLSSATTDSSGYAYFIDLSAGNYTVKSGTAPSGLYYSPTEKAVTVTAGGTVRAMFTLKAETGNMTIILSSSDGLSISGIPFSVTYPNGTVKTVTTDSSGNAYLTDIPAGTYTVAESSVPDDYIAPAAKGVTVSSGSTVTVRFNNTVQYRLSVKITEVGEAVAGKTFKVTVRYTNSGGKNAKNVQIKLTASNGATCNDPETFDIPASSGITRIYTVNAVSEGNAKATAALNYAYSLPEDTYTDNFSTATIPITSVKGDLSVTPITSNGDYVADTDVISSFSVTENGGVGIIPSSNVKAKLTVTYNGKTVDIPAKTVIVPGNGSNLVYFKWHIPSDAVNSLLTISCSVNDGKAVDETSYTNNTASFTKTAVAKSLSQTPDTQYTESAPATYVPTSPNLFKNSATWSEWVYENGSFAKRDYGITFSDGSISVVPDENSPSRTFNGSSWTMKSGYGFTVDIQAETSVISGCLSPLSDAVTEIQTAAALFPEFGYSTATGSCRALEKVNGSFVFAQNPNATGGKRLHFIPLWYPNGSYYTVVRLSDLWTPAGVITAQTVCPVLNIAGAAYDDFYVG